MKTNSQIKLYEHQQRLLDKNPRRCLLAWSTGTGKSFMALSLAEKNQASVLIIVPKALKEKWQRDAEMFPVKHLVLTKEEFKKLHEELDRFDAIITDEAHYFAGMKSQLSKAHLAYCRRVKPTYIWLLTATPYLSTPWNIYRLAQLLGVRWHYLDFLNKFFYNVKLPKKEGWMREKFIRKPRPHMEDELARHVKEIGDVVDINECADVPDQVIETVNFTTNKKQKKLIDEVKKTEANPVVKFTKLHQIENGTLKGDEYNEDKFVSADKHEYLLELIADNPKIAVFCRYNLQIDSLHSLIKSKLKGKLVYIIRGEVKNRDEIVQQIEASEDCVVLINASCSEGYELPSIGVIVFASLSFSYKDYKQAKGRFLRINKLKKNVFIHLVNSWSVDAAVMDSIMKKQDFDIAIYAKEMLQ